MQPTIQLEKVRFKYTPAASRDIIHIDSLELEQGSRNFLSGPSGSGKTTLLGLITGILSPSQGTVNLLGQPFSEMKPWQRDQFRGAQIGYIFQMFNLIPYLSVAKNIALSAKVSKERRMRSGSIPQEVERLGTALGIGDLLEQPVTSLSLGQQQRVAAARAFLGKPPLIIADEPTSALDQDSREDFLQLLFSLGDEYGATIVFVSHDKTLAPLFNNQISLSEINLTGAQGC